MKKILSLVAVFLLASMALAAPVFAAIQSNDTVVVKADQVINDDFFASGTEVIIEGTVNGDVYVAANRLAVRGTVNGDVIAGASSVEVTGTVEDDLRAAAGSISLIGANVGDSFTAAGSELSIDGESRVGGGLVFGGALLSVDGSVGRGIISGNQTARIDGPVGGTVRLASNDITIGSDANIKGNLEYQSGQEPAVLGQIQGDVVRSQTPVKTETKGFMQKIAVGFNLWALAAAAVIGGVLMLIFPGIYQRADVGLREKPWMTAGWGALALLATVPAAVLLAISLVGIPLSLITLALWVAGIYLAKLFVAYSVGHKLVEVMGQHIDGDKLPSHTYLVLLFGLLLYYALRLVPVLGPIVRLATVVVGLGMILTLYSRPEPRGA